MKVWKTEDKLFITIKMSFSAVGLETQLKLVEESIKNEEDALVVFIHWLLVKNGFLCIGLGENVST